jgi:hypothetical protein
MRRGLSVNERYESKVAEIERQVADPKFKMFFAVHETEAWLLSDPDLFPAGVNRAIEKDGRKPESVNFHEHPSLWIDRLYRKHTRQTYKKTADGRDLFSCLDPNVAYSACPYLARMLDKMLALTKDAGL